MKWISIHDRLPEKYVRVLTLLYKRDGYELAMNSIQVRSMREAGGKQLDVNQWENENIRVEYWLDGLPELPKPPRDARKKEKYSRKPRENK